MPPNSQRVRLAASPLADIVIRLPGVVLHSPDPSSRCQYHPSPPFLRCLPSTGHLKSIMNTCLPILQVLERGNVEHWCQLRQDLQLNPALLPTWTCSHSSFGSHSAPFVSPSMLSVAWPPLALRGPRVPCLRTSFVAAPPPPKPAPHQSPYPNRSPFRFPYSDLPSPTPTGLITYSLSASSAPPLPAAQFARLTVVTAQESVAISSSEAALGVLLRILERDVHVSVEAGEGAWRQLEYNNGEAKERKVAVCGKIEEGDRGEKRGNPRS